MERPAKSIKADGGIDPGPAEWADEPGAAGAGAGGAGEAVAALEQQSGAAEAELALLGANLGAQSRRERQPHPHVSVESVQAAVQSLQTQASALLETHVLAAPQLYRVRVVELRTTVMAEQLRIYRNERDYIVTGDAGSDAARYAAAVLVRQPRMQTLKRRVSKKNEKLAKKQKSQYVYQVACLSGAVTTFTPSRNVDVSLLLLEESRAKSMRGSAIALEVLTVEWDEDAGVATIAVLFADGTQVIPADVTVLVRGGVRLPDGTTLQGDLATPKVEPLVVCTNENQWEHGERRLLARQLFGGSEDEPDSLESVPWVRFCNCLVEFHIRATRQDLLELWLMPADQLAALPEPRRSLSEPDLAYIHQTAHFTGSQVVTRPQFDSFWEWYGALCHQYRHNQAVRSLYLSGVIYGLVRNEDCSNLLKENGYFLIRNSDTTKQAEYQIVMKHEGTVKFHRVDPAMVRSPYGNLADYVRDKQELVMLVKPFHERLGYTVSHGVAQRKQDALEEYYSARRGDDEEDDDDEDDDDDLDD